MAAEASEPVKLRTGSQMERNAIIRAMAMCKANGTTFVRMGCYDGLDRHGEVVPETAEERGRRLALKPRRARVTKADRGAIARRLREAGQ